MKNNTRFYLSLFVFTAAFSIPYNESFAQANGGGGDDAGKCANEKVQPSPKCSKVLKSALAFINGSGGGQPPKIDSKGKKKDELKKCLAAAIRLQCSTTTTSHAHDLLDSLNKGDATTGGGQQPQGDTAPGH